MTWKHCVRGYFSGLYRPCIATTDHRALDWLVVHSAEVRVSFDVHRTRLHAKDWLFHRPGLSGASPASTTYIGTTSRQPILLIVAHEREILNQSHATFRQVQADSYLGELLVTAPALQSFAPCVRFCAVARWAGSGRPGARHL